MERQDVHPTKMTMEKILKRWVTECGVDSLSIDIIQLIAASIFVDGKPSRFASRWRQKNALTLGIAGNQGVGKTLLALKYMDYEWPDPETAPIDFLKKRVHSDGLRISDGMRVDAQIFDLDGSPSRRSQILYNLQYFRGLFICYSITDRESLSEGVRYWNKKCKVHCAPNVERVMVGLKSDSEESRECSFEDALRIAKECGIEKVFEISTRTGSNVGEAFEFMVSRIWNRARRPFYDPIAF